MAITNRNLEEVIRDLVARGEMTHLSLTPNPSAKGWRAEFAPASVFGISYGADLDPIKAMLLAMDDAKIRRKAPFKDDPRIAQPDVNVETDADSLM